MKPKISVVMPVYNAEEYLNEAIQSILAQTYKNFEFIIINDGSTDKSEEIIKSFDDDRIKYIENESNIGLSASLNKGLNIANGEYIARMDADDISYQKRFQRQVDFLDKNKDIGVCGTWAKFFGHYNLTAKSKTNHNDIKLNLFTNCPMIHPSVMFRKNIFLENDLLYDVNLKITQDYDLWTRSIEHTKFANIPEVLLKYRINSNQLTSQNTRLIEENGIVWKRILNKLEVEFNEKEFNLHKTLLSENCKCTIEELNAWLDKIIDASIQKYDSKNLLNLLSNKIYACIKNREVDNFVNIFTGNKFRYLNMKNKIKLLYKVLKNI